MKTSIIAHRGASRMAGSDNTIESFTLAITTGAEYVEMDIRRTKDKMLIVFHDDTINDIKLETLTFKELNQEALKLGYQVPLFEDVLKLCAGKIKLDLELKETGYEKQVITLVKKYYSYDSFMLKSFLDTAVLRVKETDKKIKAGLLLGYKVADKKRRFNEYFPLRRLISCKADFVSPHYKLVTWAYALRMKLLGKDMYVWTVNDEVIMKKLLTKKVEGIITDVPDLGVSVRDKYKANKVM